MFHALVFFDLSLRPSLRTLHLSPPSSTSFLLIFHFIFCVDRFGAKPPVRFREWGVWHFGQQRPSHRLWAQLLRPLPLPRNHWNFSSRSPPATQGPRTCMTRSSVTTPSAERSLHHCSLRSEKNQRAVNKLITLLKKVLVSSQSLSVGHVRTVRPVNELSSLSSSVRENPYRDSENEQISILLERQKDQILADCKAKIQKHEFQADYDRRSIKKLNGVIGSQRDEINRAHQGDEEHRRDQQLLQEQIIGTRSRTSWSSYEKS